MAPFYNNTMQTCVILCAVVSLLCMLLYSYYTLFYFLTMFFLFMVHVLFIKYLHNYLSTHIYPRVIIQYSGQTGATHPYEAFYMLFLFYWKFVETEFIFNLKEITPPEILI